MKCPECNADRKESDFIGKQICYKCQYILKTKHIKSNRYVRCRRCEKPLAKGRWIYCSIECANAGASLQKKEYWTNKL